MIQANERICIFPEHQKMAVLVPDELQAAVSNLPHVEMRAPLALMPWSTEYCRLLANMGLETNSAAPIRYSQLPLVEGQFQPMSHQIATAAFVTMYPRCYVLNDPRTGKTGSLILAADYLQRAQHVQGAWLIVTTVTTIHSVWAVSIQRTLPHARVGIAHGAQRNAVFNESYDYIVTNYDTCRLSRDVIMQAIANGAIQGLIVDELTHVGNVTSQRHKAIAAMFQHPNIRWGVGATGTPGSDADAIYGMCRAVNPMALPCRTLTSWRTLTTYSLGGFRRYLMAGAPQLFHKTMQPAIRYNKADILDLPPVTTRDVSIEPTKEQKKHMAALRADALTMLESGEAITATNGGVLFGKMLQVAQGFITTDGGDKVVLDHKTRTEALVDLIKESTAKVVVFGVYRYGNTMLQKELESAGIKADIIDGSITGKKRAEILKRFQTEAELQVLICHPTTTAYGVELSAADTMIFNGAPPLGDFVYGQALERLSSAKQRARSIQVIRLSATSEERKLFRALTSGQQQGSFIQALFESYQEQ